MNLKKEKTDKKKLDKKHEIEIIENKILFFNELDSMIMGI